MKYIITDKQYQILKEQTEQVLKLPSVDYFGGWDNLQQYLTKKNNPPYSIDGELNLADSNVTSLGNLKGVKRGYGMDYFQNMSALDRLIKKLKKLDEPNIQVMNELAALNAKVSNLNMPQQRKQALTSLIENSLYHFNAYYRINDQIINQIKTLNLDSWK